MTSAAPPPPAPPAPDRTPGGSGGTGDPWATGGLTLGGTLMVVYGLFAVLQGITAIADDEVYTSFGDYVFEFDLTAWGWIHLIVGVLVVAAGLGLFTGAAWARIVGAVVVGLALIANFMWLPYQPFWSIIMIVTGLFVLWSVFNYRSTRAA
ncbi:putative lysophospholipase L1 biosynthesis ABC-type transport system permease subunit [Streptomyces africanus]|uniref:Lysophospholipase L1 biosynthesis ABC-type transport system permease subunit n=1 Tax=Streptomyces africanus TaxID=231024 RepID=A0ABU0QXL9_9ACTN|nr:hypothetical protein [Streptomyces africanus]MDQ0752117.1 putative lysophospholipase L1 biosynthesis ABC-type transport system permease subunit [Streptomyces africanus]